MKLPHSLVFPILGLVFSACSGAGIRSTEARIRLDFSAGLTALYQDALVGNPPAATTSTPRISFT